MMKWESPPWLEMCDVHSLVSSSLTLAKFVRCSQGRRHCVSTHWEVLHTFTPTCISSSPVQSGCQDECVCTRVERETHTQNRMHVFTVCLHNVQMTWRYPYGLFLRYSWVYSRLFLSTFWFVLKSFSLCIFHVWFCVHVCVWVCGF